MFSWFMKKQQPQLEFLCFDDDLGNIPEPYPARKLIPEWYKALPCYGDRVDHPACSGCQNTV